MQPPVFAKCTPLSYFRSVSVVHCTQRAENRNLPSYLDTYHAKTDYKCAEFLCIKILILLETKKLLLQKQPWSLKLKK